MESNLLPVGWTNRLKTQQLLPIFPLPAQLMPDGKLALQIFEPRYLRMVKECAQNRAEFGVVMMDCSDAYTATVTFQPIGTRARIVDFDQLDHNVLEVTVCGGQSFKINGVEIQKDGLNIANVESIPLWPARALPKQEHYIARQLCNIYEQYPKLGELYTNRKLNNLTWLCQRWLEILPLAVQQKQELMATTTCERTHQLLTKLLQSYG